MTNESKHKITHVIFDMDGLLLDTEPLYTVATDNVTKRFGHDFPIEVKVKMMGRTSAEAAQILIDDLQLPIDVVEYSRLISEEYRQVFSQFVPTMPGAERLVRHLHAKGVPIAVATSSRNDTFQLKTSQHKELFGLFHHIVIAPEDKEITHGKPHPQSFLVAASRFDPPPQDMAQVLVFEDSVAGVQAANAAGMVSVWIPDQRFFSDHGDVRPTLKLNSLEDFKPELFGLEPF